MLVDTVLQSETADPMSLPLSDADRALLAEILMNEHEELTPDALELAIQTLRERKLKKEFQALKLRMDQAARSGDWAGMAALQQELKGVETALGIRAIRSGQPQ